MSEDEKHLSQFDDTISTVEDIPGSSISFSIRENSIYVKEKPKVERIDPVPVEPKQEQWWLKKPTAQLDIAIQKKSLESKKPEIPILSPDVSSSTKDFLAKEKMCKNGEDEIKDNDSTLQDILASVAFDKYQSDFDSATDDDIGSILEEMSKITGNITPSLEMAKLKSGILTEEGSIKELLQEAEKLVQENGNDLLKGILKTEIVVPDENNPTSESLTRVRQLEVDIFKMIEEQVKEDKDTSNKQRSISPSIEIVYENIKSPKSLETQNKKFVGKKFETPSSSDVDDSIERHSSSDDVRIEKKVDDKREKINLKKEITDVEKDYFDTLIKNTKESTEQLSPQSLSFDKEDFTHFLKLLQEHSDKDKDDFPRESEPNVLDQFDPLKEKKIVSERELDNTAGKKVTPESDSATNKVPFIEPLQLGKLSEKNSQKNSSKYSSRDSSKMNSARNSVDDTKKVVNDKNEFYTVGLTPRLKLFADDIPKLLAEKTNKENAKRIEAEKLENDKEITPKSENGEDFSFKNFKALDACTKMEILNDHKNVKGVKDIKDLIDFRDNQDFDMQKSLQSSTYFQNSVNCIGMKNSSNYLNTQSIVDVSTNKNTRRDRVMEKSRSYDQLSKSSRKLGSSLENIKTIKVTENRKQMSTTVPKKLPAPKIKIQPKTITKLNPRTKVTSKTTKEPLKSLPNEFGLNVKGSQIKSYEDDVTNSFGGGDWIGTLKEDTLENLYQKEKLRFINIKLELEAKIEAYKSELNDMQMVYDQKIFSLKKQNILLKSKMDELINVNNKVTDGKPKYDPKIMSMQKDLDRQENLISAYESENKKLLQEMKKLQSELKASNQIKSKMIQADNKNNDQKLLEKLKDLQEEVMKLNIEVSNLRQKNNDFSLKNEDITQQNYLLQEELEMIKDQLRAKNDFITDRLQSMTTNELDLRKQVEDLKIELHSKTEQLKLIKLDYEKFQENIEPVEKELLDLRGKCTYYQDKLQSAKHNCEREKQLTLKLKDQVILDNKNIMDLNRQVREMERILKRKNPDSVSALILTANSENEKLNLEKMKLLEDRIIFLEDEIKSKEDIAQSKLMDLQKKFTDMKDKYSMQVSDLELKLQLSQKERKICEDVGTQTMHRILESRGSEPNLAEKSGFNKIGPKSQNVKEDTHLIATIRGLKQELGNKEKTIAKLTKDVQEQQKTSRKLQKEREKLLNERRNMEKMCNRTMALSDSKLLNTKAAEINDPNSNFYQNNHFLDTKRSMPSGVEITEMNNKLKRLSNENEVLKEELSRINKDFMALKNKRLHDLNILQEEHEKELGLILKECNVKIGDTQAYKLQGQVNSQMSMITHLQQQIETLQDYKDQVVILKAEREHLEGKNRILNEKVKYLTTPSSQQLQCLQDKITLLQQRHETRELGLQKLVRDMLRNRSQSCQDCKKFNEMEKSPCYYRQEIENVLGMLQDLASP